MSIYQPRNNFCACLYDRLYRVGIVKAGRFGFWERSLLKRVHMPMSEWRREMDFNWQIED